MALDLGCGRGHISKYLTKVGRSDKSLMIIFNLDNMVTGPGLEDYLKSSFALWDCIEMWLAWGFAQWTS